MGDLTKDFDVSEFWPEKYGKCPDSQLAKLWYLASTIIQPLRDTLGPITIDSGYRPAEANALVAGASPTSDHMYKGFSVCGDLKFRQEAAGTYNSRLEAIVWLWQRAPNGFGQAILYANKPHLHVSLPTPKHQGETWVMHDAKGLKALIEWRKDQGAGWQMVKDLMARFQA